MKVLIVGDVKHSRVARTDLHALRTLGTGEIRVCGPQTLLPDDDTLQGCVVGDDFDAITIFLGTNDFIGDVPLGEWYERTLKTTKAAMGYPAREYEWLARTPVMDNTTLRGRINIAVSTLKSMFPQKQIVILTPIHRAFATFGAENVQPDESFPNKIGIYFLEYVNAVKEAGNVWGIPVVDLNSLCGINPMIEEQVLYFGNSETDRLHPNAKGHERLARTLMYQLLTLPCRF